MPRVFVAQLPISRKNTTVLHCFTIGSYSIHSIFYDFWGLLSPSPQDHRPQDWTSHWLHPGACEQDVQSAQCRSILMETRWSPLSGARKALLWAQAKANTSQWLAVWVKHCSSNIVGIFDRREGGNGLPVRLIGGAITGSARRHRPSAPHRSKHAVDSTEGRWEAAEDLSDWEGIQPSGHRYEVFVKGKDETFEVHHQDDQWWWWKGWS